MILQYLEKIHIIRDFDKLCDKCDVGQLQIRLRAYIFDQSTAYI